jgi:hypothetical protein
MEFEISLADREQRLSIPVRLHRGRGTPAQLSDLVVIERREGNGLKIMVRHSYPLS